MTSATPVVAKSDDPTPPGLNATLSKRPLWRQFLDVIRGCFQSLPMAIVLLSLMAVGVVIGVLVPQESLVEPAKIKAEYGEWYLHLKALGAFNAFSSPWFLTLEVLFFFNLLLGSFRWLKPAYLAATRTTFYSNAYMGGSPEHFFLDITSQTENACAQMTTMLRRFGYQVKQSPESDATKQTWQLYASKGNWSRLGPVVAHLGILILLVASVYGAFTGFTAQKIMAPGGTFTLDNVDAFMPNMDKSWWQGSIPSYKIKVHDFKTEFYQVDPTVPKQFYANIELLDKENHSLKRQEISVNHPMDWQDLTIYQASYVPTGKLNLLVDGKPVTVSVNTRFQDRPASITPISAEGTPGEIQLVVFPFLVQQDTNVTQNHVRVFLHQGQSFVGAQSGKMPENLKLTEGEAGRLGNHIIAFMKAEYATGLQIKKAPHVPFIYAAFLIISLGTIMCFFSQRQLWISCELLKDSSHSCIVILPKTNKARFSFMRELERLKLLMVQQFALAPLIPIESKEPVL